jgi:hypothetical protein
LKLSLADKVALIYTLAGSQRGAASLIGVSHQKVGRILRTGYEGGYRANSRALDDPGLIAAVNQAFAIHSQVSRQQARAHDLPFNAAIPVFYERKPLPDGRIGDRVVALHTHWLSDRLRNAWIASLQKSGKFYAASISSIVDLVLYSKRATVNQRGPYMDTNGKTAIDRRIEQQTIRGLIYTKYTPMDPRFPTYAVIDDLNSKLNQKHSPAVGAAGTAIATSILLQVDTRKDESGKSKDAAFRSRHPGPAKPRKARGNKPRAD